MMTTAYPAGYAAYHNSVSGNKKVKLKKIVDIYSVIEMSPWRVQPDIEYDITSEDREDFETFVLRVYKNAGMKSINKIDSTPCYSIKLSDINDEDLIIIIEKELEDADIGINGLEFVGAFSGGIVFQFENEEKIYHHSGSISDYKNWLKLATDKSEEWEEVWYGYPAFYARVKNNVVQIAEVIPNAKPKNDDIIAEFEHSEFNIRIEKITKDIKEFKKRIHKILLGSNNKYANEIPELLIELSHNEPK